MNILITAVVLALASKDVLGQGYVNFTDVNIFYSCYEKYADDLLFTTPVRYMVTTIQTPYDLDIQHVAKDGSTTDSFSCSNEPINFLSNTVEITQYQPGVWQLRLEINPATGSVDPTCGIKVESDGLGPGEYEWKLIINTDDVHEDLRFEYENTFVFRCNYSDPATVSTYQTERILLNVAGSGAIITSQLSDFATLFTVDPTTLQPLNVITVGSMTRLAAALVVEGAPTPPTPYYGVSPYNCRACVSLHCTTGAVLQLTDNNGCSVDTVILPSGFTSTLSGDPKLLYTSAFSMFVFAEQLLTSSTTVTITCDFDYCTVNTLAGLAQCNNRCTSLGKRKKREAGKPSPENDVASASTTTKLVYPDNYDVDGSVLGKLFKNIPQSPTPTRDDDTPIVIKCYESTGFIVAVCLLGGVLFLAILISTCLCLRLSALRRQKESLYSSSSNVSVNSGKGNTAYY